MPSAIFSKMDDHETVSPNPGLRVPEEQAPVLPQKSALRASRLLNNLVGLKLTMPTDPPAFKQTPHDEYLSSEEEASSTAGDFSDFEYESSSDDTAPSPANDQMSHQDTARVVSVIFSGKPSVVNVLQNRRSISPISHEGRRSASGSESQNNMASDREIRRRSTSASTASSNSTCTKPVVAHPPRSSSRQPPTEDNTMQKDKPFFLQIDPYANGSMYSLGSRQPSKEVEDDERPKTPKTPTQLFRGVARSLSLMKKRSIPRMNQSFMSASTERIPLPTSPSKLSIPEEPLTEEITTVVSAPPATPQRPPPQPISAPVTYDDIVRVAKKNEKLLAVQRTPTADSIESPATSMSPSSAANATNGKRVSSFNAARRRMSVKLTGRFQL